MKTVQTIKALRHIRSQLERKTVGFVPTMGYLHDGHVSLIKKARNDCDVVFVSIFVNPLQFGPQEDLSTYPRDLQRDRAIAEQAGVDVLFTPTVEEMYPSSPLTIVTVSKLTDVLCGASRPTFFDGVATVVTKLFNIVQPHRAYFGLKDAQQVAVIQQMVKDLNMPVSIVPCPTVRESDGLATSSRNVYLSAEERKQATVLYRTLSEAKERLARGEWKRARDVETWVGKKIAAQPLAQIDYVNMRTYPALETVDEIVDGDYILAVAVKFGRARLIDNVLVQIAT